MTTDELLDFVRQYVEEHHPDTRAVRVVVALADGEEMRLPICACPRRSTAAPAAELPRIGRIEKVLLKAAAGLDVDAPTGPEIAAAAKLPYEAELRKLLSALRTKGCFGGRKNDQGYPLTPLGLAVIQDDG